MSFGGPLVLFYCFHFQYFYCDILEDDKRRTAREPFLVVSLHGAFVYFCDFFYGCTACKADASSFHSIGHKWIIFHRRIPLLHFMILMTLLWYMLLPIIYLQPITYLSIMKCCFRTSNIIKNSHITHSTCCIPICLLCM